MMDLRPYQVEALDAIRAAESRGVRRQLVALPTGTGKTIVFANLIRERHGRALVLAHRDELIAQAVDKLRLVAPELALSIGICKAERDDIHKRILVASVQTLSRPQRLERLPRDLETVIVDEAHHSTAETYRRILEVAGSFRNDGPLLVGFTAAAFRADGEALGDIFPEVVFERGILPMIREGFLADLRGLQIRLAKADFHKLHSRYGEFIDSEAEEILMAANAPEHAAQAYLEHATGRKGLLFTPTVRVAYAMAEAFREHGIAAEALDGSTPIDERREILLRFHKGATRVVSNCAVLIEGYDHDAIDSIVIARPTRSKGLYVQMVGRGTRPYPGKKDCLVVDLVGATSRHDLMTITNLFPETRNGDSLLEAIGRTDQEQEAHLVQGELVARTVDLFARARFAWIRASESRFVLSTGHGTVILKTENLETWTALLRTRETEEVLIEGVPIHYAQGVAEDLVRQHRAEALADRNARR